MVGVDGAIYIRVPGSGVVTLRRVRGDRGPALVVRYARLGLALAQM